GEQLSFSGKEAGPILEIAPLVELFGLSHNIQRWITDYLSGSRYHLNYFKGHLPWANPAALLDTLEAEVRVDDTEYIFAQGLEAVKGEYTDVVFANGVLAIRPHGTTFYGQDGGDSRVDIDFNDPSHIILSIHIETSAIANDDVLGVLEYYGISIPFKQLEGTTDAEVSLVINLNNLEIDSEGVFTIGEGLVSYGEEIFKVRDAQILLKGSHVTLEQLRVAYKELFVAQITGNVLAKDGVGDLEIVFEQVDFKTNGSRLQLVDSPMGVKAAYHFDVQGHTLEAEASSWQFNSHRIELGAFRAPVELDNYSLDLHSVDLRIQPGIQTEVSGALSIKKKTAELACDLSRLHVNDLMLLSSNISVEIGYDQDWVFRTREPSQWSLNNMPITLYPLDVQLDNQFIKVAESRISYGSFFDSQISGELDYQNKQGAFYLKKIDVTDQNLEENLEIGQETLVQLDNHGEHTIISVPEFDLRISTDIDKNWSASFGDLSMIYDRSKLLQRYKVKAGSLTLSSENGRRPFKLTADILSPYPFLIDQGKPIDELKITGSLGDQRIRFTVNGALNFDHVGNQLKVASNGVAFNIPAFISLVNDLPQSTTAEDDEKGALLVSLDASDSYLQLSPNSRILADRIEVEYLQGIIGMRLTHGPGILLLRVENGTFFTEGSNLNETFMEALIQDSNFEGGQMHLGAMGRFDDFSAVFEIKDTVLTNLKTLNNVMAFINTVPALITFSLPEYHSTGLPLRSAVVGMNFKDKRVTLESIEFISPSLRGAGIGWLDFSERLIDLDVNLISQKKINIGKVPLAGYVLEGKKGESSITIKVEGNLDDPEVTHSLFREIVAKPVKVLFRALTLPIHLLQEMGRSAADQQNTSRALP
ncbi:MAG: AsmA-like C-terminal domain-containing protein, partial [Desulfocapsaceae bacterium]